MKAQRHELLEQRPEIFVMAVRRAFEQTRGGGRMAHHELTSSEQLARLGKCHRQWQVPQRLFGSGSNERRPVRGFQLSRLNRMIF